MKLKADLNFFIYTGGKQTQLLPDEILDGSKLSDEIVEGLKKRGMVREATEEDIAKWEAEHGKGEEPEEPKEPEVDPDPETEPEADTLSVEPTTIAELKTALDELGIEYKANDSKGTLEELYNANK